MENSSTETFKVGGTELENLIPAPIGSDLPNRDNSADAADETMNASNAEPKPNQPLSVSGRNLEDLEAVIDRMVPNYEAAAFALFEIHHRKLYAPLYRSFRDYVEQRWHFSRARAYQLLHFAQIKRMSTVVDTERQARNLDRQGVPRRAHGDDRDPVLRAMRYLVKVFHALASGERRDFIESIRDLLSDLKMELGPNP
jgi:hypothetical protein